MSEKGLFQEQEEKGCECYPISAKGVPFGKVPSNLIDVYDKGKEKIRKTFAQKLYESFPDIRYRVLTE